MSTPEPLDWQSKQAIERAWVDFLSDFQYNGWFTLTFREPAKSSINAIDRASYVLRKFYDKRHEQVDAFVVAEEHKSGSWHTHGMLTLGGKNFRENIGICRELWSRGFEKYGICRFSVIESRSHVQGYVSKYLVKRYSDHRFLKEKTACSFRGA